MIKLASISEVGEHYVKLKLNSETNCNDCKSRCSDGFLRFLFHKNNHSEILVCTENSKNHSSISDEQGFFESRRKVGDKIGLKLNDKELMFLSLLLYAIPILLIIIFLPLAYMLGSFYSLNADFSGLLGVILSLIFSKILLYRYRSRVKFKVQFFE